MLLFEADPVAGDYCLVESEPGLRAVPVDEFANGMIVRSLGTSGGKAIKDRRFRLFEIGEFQNGFRIAFAFVLGHSSSLHDLECIGSFQSMMGRLSEPNTRGHSRPPDGTDRCYIRDRLLGGRVC